jgi:hypothetical protein
MKKVIIIVSFMFITLITVGIIYITLSVKDTVEGTVDTTVDAVETVVEASRIVIEKEAAQKSQQIADSLQSAMINEIRFK